MQFALAVCTTGSLQVVVLLGVERLLRSASFITKVRRYLHFDWYMNFGHQLLCVQEKLDIVVGREISSSRLYVPP